MKKNTLNEIKNMDIKAIVQKLKEAKKELVDLLLDKNMGKLKDLKAVYKKRKDVARMLTVLQQKQSLEELESSSRNQESRIKSKVETKESKFDEKKGKITTSP